MTLPINFKKSEENIIASYDYVDIAEGTGIVNFYAGYTKDSTSTKLVLKKATFYSREGNGVNHTRADTTATSFTKLIDLDFDTAAFNLPKVISGTMLCNVPFAIQNSGGVVASGYVTVKLRKWDGSTETEIANATSETVAMAPLTSPYADYMVFSVTIPTTGFKKGEILRITVEGYGKNASASTCAIGVAYEPTGVTIPVVTSGGAEYNALTWAASKTVMVFYVPFRIDL